VGGWLSENYEKYKEMLGSSDVNSDDIDTLLRKDVTNTVDLVEDGVSVYLNQNRSESIRPNTRNIVSSNPEAVILIKKKAFSTLKSANDLQWMDKTEKFLLRATKALFAYKVTQIRAYESLTKLDDYYEKNRSINLLLFSDFLYNIQMLALQENTHDQQSNYLIEQFTLRYGPSETWSAAQRDEFQREIGAISSSNLSLSVDGEIDLLIANTRRRLAKIDYDGIGKDDMASIASVLKRNAFGPDAGLTTWIVDPSNTDNYTTGPGTGVIELTLFNAFTTNCSIESTPSQTSFVIEDPYRILDIIEDDIELAINEALSGTIGVLSSMAGSSGVLASQNSNVPLIDGAMIGSSMLELAGLGSMDDTLDMDYVRDRLRTFYLGRPFINAADSVNIFIRGNRMTNDYSNSGAAMNSLSIMDKSEYSIDEVMLKAEKKLYAGNVNEDVLDLDAYLKMRDNSSLSMVHVFGGFVRNTSSSFTNGKNTVSVSCIDNMEWLRWSRVIGQPALNDPQGLLEDPVTPFDIKSDSSGAMSFQDAPELLYENKILIGTGLLTYNSGILNGQFASENNIVQGQYNLGGSLFGAMKVQAPSGFVYRWKKGIITATAGLTSNNPLFNDWSKISQYTEAYGVSIGEDVFNNLDTANILSMLIVGQPYNVDAFIRQAYEIQGISNTNASTLSSSDPLFSVLNATRKQNLKFGNFKPYRVITMNASSVERLASDSVLKTEANTKIEQLQKRKAELRNTIKKLKANSPAGSKSSVITSSLVSEIKTIDAGIQKQLAMANLDKNSLDNQGHDTSFNLFGETQDMANSGNYEADQNISRAMTQVGAQRRVDDVRMNNDHNLFIISDQYDSNTEIKQYLFQLKKGGWNLFSGQFYTTYEKCVEASSIVDLEFFCNSAGHIELRPPQWNRTPLSVLRDYLQISRSENKNIIPEFLQNLFQTRIQSLRREVHALNVKIALTSLLMGFFPDRSIIPGMSISGSESLKFFGILVGDSEASGGDAAQVSLYTEYENFGSSLVGALTKGASLIDAGSKNGAFGFSLDMNGGDPEGDILLGDTETLLGDFDPISQEVMSLSGQTNIINELFPVASPTSAPPGNVSVGGITGSSSKVDVAAVARISVVEEIRKSFKRLSGIDPLSSVVGGDVVSFSDFASGNPAIPADGKLVAVSSRARAENEINDSIQVTKKFELLKVLKNAISQRDSKVSTLKRNIEKQKELDEIERALSSGYADPFDQMLDQADDPNALIKNESGWLDTLKGVYDVTKQSIDILTGDATESTLWDHLIIDDTRNYLGPGSGKRFVIKNHNIIRSEFRETPPDFTRVNVVGDAPIYGESYRRSFQGVAFWCGATDFDLWRQYGYKQSGDIKLNFAANAELQCKPYAIMQLQMQRAKINSGSVTVVGNEYYQPGDVVYVQYKNLLYYVTQVSHAFQMGGSYTTTLTLTNGHPVGSYLPSPFDIIGQQFVGNPLHEGILVHKSTSGDDGYIPLQPDCTLLFPPNVTIDDHNVSTLLDFQNNQNRYYNMMLDLSSKSVMTDETYVVIRGFVTGDGVTDQTAKVKRRMEAVRNLLVDPVQMTQGEFSSMGGDDVLDMFRRQKSTKGITTMILPNGNLAKSIPEDKIILQTVNLNGGNNTVDYSIECMNRDIFNRYELEQGNISRTGASNVSSQAGKMFSANSFWLSEDEKANIKAAEIKDSKNKFPNGGPSQGTWFHTRDGLAEDPDAVQRAIEVGIIKL